jgi:two-component system sensor histidine kinase ResE
LSINPSLATRLRVGFVLVLIVLGGVTVAGVGRLFQLRRDFENASSRSYQLELATERMRSAFVLEQASLTRFNREPKASRSAYRAAAATYAQTTAAAQPLAAHDVTAAQLLGGLTGAEATWRQRVGDAILAKRGPPRFEQRNLARDVLDAGAAIASYEHAARDRERRRTARDTRHTLALVLIGLLAAVAGAGAFFLGLANSMREPLARLITAARRLAARDLESRVEVTGPIETAELGEAFNEMAGELQSAYRRIEEVRNQLSVTLESLADGLVTVDGDGTVTRLNPAARSLLPAARVGADVNALLPDADEPLRELVQAHRRGELRASSEGRVLSILVSPLGGAQGAVLSIRDVSEGARIERLKDEFVATASHELRSPLTSVRGFAELLMMDRDKLTPEQAQNVGIILEGTNHLGAVLNNLLDLARSDAGRLTVDAVPCEVETLVDDTVKLFRPRFEQKSQALEVDVQPKLPRVLVEPARFKQVLGNLLTNANEYTQEGGRISVTAATVGKEIEVSVKDNGPGIPPDKLEEVFGRFTRLDIAEREGIAGSGLGLAISKSLVELHGGRIEAASALGEGSTFRFALPATRRAAVTPVRQPTKRRANAEADGGTGAKVATKAPARKAGGKAAGGRK